MDNYINYLKSVNKKHLCRKYQILRIWLNSMWICFTKREKDILPMGSNSSELGQTSVCVMVVTPQHPHKDPDTVMGNKFISPGSMSS